MGTFRKIRFMYMLKSPTNLVHDIFQSCLAKYQEDLGNVDVRILRDSHANLWLTARIPLGRETLLSHRKVVSLTFPTECCVQI